MNKSGKLWESGWNMFCQKKRWNPVEIVFAHFWSLFCRNLVSSGHFRAKFLSHIARQYDFLTSRWPNSRLRYFGQQIEIFGTKKTDTMNTETSEKYNTLFFSNTLFFCTNLRHTLYFSYLRALPSEYSIFFLRFSILHQRRTQFSHIHTYGSLFSGSFLLFPIARYWAKRRRKRKEKNEPTWKWMY